MSETASGLPPAGWYIQPAQPTVERWWDGAVWTDHSRAVAAAPETSAPEAPPHPEQRGGIRCPLCRSDDQLRRVSVVVGEGKTATRGTALTLAQQDGRTRIAPTVYGSRGATELSKRLTPPWRPHFPWYVHFVLWLLGIAVIFGIYGAISASADDYTPTSGTYIGGFIGLFIVGLFAGFMPAALFTFLTGAFRGPVWRDRQAEWDRQNERLGAAYFCARDDVIVENGVAHKPEQFITQLFDPAKAQSAPV